MPYLPLPFGSFSFGGDRLRRSESLLRCLKAVTGVDGDRDLILDGDEGSNLDDDGGSNMALKYSSVSRAGLSVIEGSEGVSGSVLRGVDGGGVDGGGVDGFSPEKRSDAALSDPALSDEALSEEALSDVALYETLSDGILPEALSEVLDTRLFKGRDGSVLDDAVRPWTVLLGSHASLRMLAGDMPTRSFSLSVCCPGNAMAPKRRELVVAPSTELAVDDADAEDRAGEAAVDRVRIV